jgi:hypothetical protein
MMKTLLFLAVSAAFLIPFQIRAADFSKGLSPDDFAAAGLAKLSPDELAHLNALVQANRLGTTPARTPESSVGTPKPDESVPVSPRSAEQSRVARETPIPPKAEEHIVVAAGTKVSYREVETQLAGIFRGYEVGTILTLANGQRWMVTSGNYWASKNDFEKTRKVVIKPGALGSFFLEIEDGGRPKVKLVGSSSAPR